MAEKVLMPQLSDTMETGIIVDWKVEEGDEVKTGDILAEVETDKATMELEAFDSGVLLKKMVAEGEEVPTQELIAVIGEEGEDISDLIEVSEETGGETEKVKEEDEAEKGEEAQEEESEEQEEETSEQSSGRGEGGRIRISPVARKISDEHGIDVSKIEGSGSEGRITKKDVEKAIESGVTDKTGKAPSEALKSEKVELSSMRRTIARRMSQSKREIPHFHLQTEIDMENTVSLREDFRDDEREVSYNDFILLAAVRALLEVSELNVSYEKDYLQKYGHINLAFAVALEDGLITPVIENAQNLNLLEIQKASRRLAEKARQGNLNPEQYNKGTFTVSNLGMYGITNFSAVINPPQAAILAVGAVEERPVSRDGKIISAPRMSVTLSCDHRAVDGSQGARYLQVLKELLEHPGRLVFS